MSVDTTERPGAAHPEPARRRGTPEWVDRLIGSDPGLNRLLMALQAVVSIGIAMLAEYVFVKTTHALQIPGPPKFVDYDPQAAAGIAAQHHGVLVIAIMLGAIMGMLASFGGTMFAGTKPLLVGLVSMPVPMVGGLALGLALAPHRILALASFVVVLGLGTYARRWGPMGFFGGQLVFMGDFFGFFLNGAITLHDLGWLTLEIVIGVAVAVLAQFTLFFPNRRAALRRMRRSYASRSRTVVRAALDVLDAQDESEAARARRRLHRLLVRLNECALMIDAQLGVPGTVTDPAAAAVLHQRIFDAELGLSNVARFAARLAGLPVPQELARLLRATLVAIADRDMGSAELLAVRVLDELRSLPELPQDVSSELTDDSEHTTRVLLHRFANSVLTLVGAVHADAGDPEGEFTPSTQLMAGFLPGSTLVSAMASQESGHRTTWTDRVRLAPNVRTALQMSVAVAGAVVFGDLLSGRRFYWAVIAAFVTFMGANNAGEQIRKGALRVAGTFIGVIIGALLAHAVGTRTDLAIVVILAALFLGLYFMRISYAFMVVGITVMVSQLYVQLDEFTNSLLVLRLEETAIGAAVAALTVIVVLPLRTGRVVTVAARRYVDTLQDVTGAAVDELIDPRGRSALRAAMRRLDAAYQEFTATTAVLTPRGLIGSPPDAHQDRLTAAVTASRHYARNLITDTSAAGCLPDDRRDAVEVAGRRLADSLQGIVGVLQDGDVSRSYVRSAALFSVVATGTDLSLTDPCYLALRDLQLVDGAMVRLARAIGMPIEALDTDASLELHPRKDLA